MKKQGFTLAELLITVVILAVLAGLALPNFQNAAEKAKWNQAIAYLRVLRTGEKMYFAKNAEYIGCDASTCDDLLGAEVPASGDFTYSVTANNAVSPKTFLATATRGTGGINIDQDGLFTYNGTGKPSYVKDPN